LEVKLEISNIKEREKMYDFHTHFIPENVMIWIKKNKASLNAEWVKKAADKEEFLVIDGKWGFELKTAFHQLDHHKDGQRQNGITHSVLSPIPQLFMYDFPANITIQMAEIYNRSLSEIVSESPNDMSGLATVALNQPLEAARQLREAMSSGLIGAIIGPGLSGKMLSDEFFSPFFAEADTQGAILFIHPLLCEDPRLQKKMMPNLIGVPWETTVCAVDILLSGFNDRYPNIKFLLAHGGGFLPYQAGRLDKGYGQWNQVSSNLHYPPSSYLKKFWYDTVLWNSEALDFLVQTVGVDKVVPGSDYPFDLCECPPENLSENGAMSLLGKPVMK
jgi:aminocarboxymuconate-semialdehyde decarboxylase